MLKPSPGLIRATQESRLIDALASLTWHLALCWVLKTVLKVFIGLLFNAYLELIEGQPGVRLRGWARRSVSLLTSFVP